MVGGGACNQATVLFPITFEVYSCGKGGVRVRVRVRIRGRV